MSVYLKLVQPWSGERLIQYFKLGTTINSYYSPGQWVKVKVIIDFAAEGGD